MQARDRKEEEFKALYLRTYAPFCIYAKHFVCEKPACEDIVSGVFANLWQKKEELDFCSETILGYIKICVKNSCLNHIKQQYFRENQHVTMEKEIAAEYEISPDKVYDYEELMQQLSFYLDRLPPKYKQIFIKCYFEGKKTKEVAEELQVNERTIRRHNRKVIDFLKEKLKEFTLSILFIALCHKL